MSIKELDVALVEQVSGGLDLFVPLPPLTSGLLDVEVQTNIANYQTGVNNGSDAALYFRTP